MLHSLPCAGHVSIGLQRIAPPQFQHPGLALLGHLFCLDGFPFVLGTSCCFFCLYVEVVACITAASSCFRSVDCWLAASSVRRIIRA